MLNAFACVSFSRARFPAFAVYNDYPVRDDENARASHVHGMGRISDYKRHSSLAL